MSRPPTRFPRSLASRLLLPASWLVLAASPGSARTWLVPEEVVTIQAACDSAQVADTVLVASGTYRGIGNRDIDFKGKSIVVTSRSGLEATVLDIQGSSADPHRGVYFHSQESREAVFEGFTLINGFMSTAPSRPQSRAAHNLSGGGIQVQGASPTIRDCLIRDCQSDFTGGGISIELGSQPKVERLTVQGCVAGLAGGGLSVETGSQPELTDLVLTGNNSIQGGGLALSAFPMIHRLLVAGNSAQRGGGIDLNGFATARLEQAIVWNNCATEGGPEIFHESVGLVEFHCAIVDSSGIAGPGEFQFDRTVHDDPRFCGEVPCDEAPSTRGDYTLREGSPGLSPTSVCGLLYGVLGLGCADNPLRPITWGRLKQGFRADQRSADGSRSE